MHGWHHRLLHARICNCNGAFEISLDGLARFLLDPASTPSSASLPFEEYCASLAHKTNHSFIPNTEFVVFDHPRWGVIPCLASIHTIQMGEEIFVKYGYDLDFCPDWYLAAWEDGNIN